MQKKSGIAKSRFSRYKLVKSNNTRQKSKNNVHGNNSEIITQMQKSVEVMESLTREVKNMSEETKKVANSTNRISWFVFLLTIGSVIVGLTSMAISAHSAIFSIQSIGLNYTTDPNHFNETVNQALSNILNIAFFGCVFLVFVMCIVLVFIAYYIYKQSKSP